ARRAWVPEALARPFLPFSSQFRCYAGSQWFSARRNCAEHILQWHSLNASFARHYSRTHVPDESYFHSILGNSTQFSVSQDCKRYVDWSAGGNSPKTLGIEDLPDILASTAHFARKFDPLHDSEILDHLDRLLA